MHNVQEDLITTDFIPFLSTARIKVHTLRLDKIHPVISGNKWYKLQFYLQEAISQNKKAVVTYGGAYSNHIIATAAACRNIGIKSIGIIRGEAPKNCSDTLKNAIGLDMELHFVSREAYKNKTLPDVCKRSDYYVIPEGGYGALGAKGVTTIPYDKTTFNIICCAAGTGTMMAGIINGKSGNSQIIGFSVLKNNINIEPAIRNLLTDKNYGLNINHDFHFGGYAKHPPMLIDFMNELYSRTGIPTDFVYTAKLFYGVKKLIEANAFAKASNILIIHSGGLQGNLSLRKGTLMF